MTPSLISVVIPVYGCAGCLEALCERLNKTLQGMATPYEIILVDDRSPDNAWQHILEMKARYENVRGLRLSRNFGQHIAITAGLESARGDYVVVMDCDLQDPPEHIPALYARMQEGYDLVLAKRISRSHSGFRVWGARLYFALLSRMTNERVDGSYGTFSLLSRKVVDAFLIFRERERHYLFIVRWLGFSAGTVEYAHEARSTGCSSYSLKRLVKHALDGLFFQSTILLRWIVGAGLTFAAGGIALALYYTYRYFSEGAVAGWTSVVVLILICTGAILSCLGVIGQYIGKIFDQIKGRPLYIIDSDTVE